MSITGTVEQKVHSIIRRSGTGLQKDPPGMKFCNGVQNEPNILKVGEWKMPAMILSNITA
jgi:hypothetical protein